MACDVCTTSTSVPSVTVVFTVPFAPVPDCATASPAVYVAEGRPFSVATAGYTHKPATPQLASLVHVSTVPFFLMPARRTT